jgi:cytidylate kinase
VRRSRKKLVVAIDGPAGAGKSTASKRLALALGYSLLDTGALYRSVALLAKQKGISWKNGSELANLAAKLKIRFKFDGTLNKVFIGRKEVSAAIRTPEISQGASQVSAHPEVRAALLDLQRNLGKKGGVVAEGRDIGTVVFPEAAAKFFLTASDEVRARRRYIELRAQGKSVDFDATLAEIRNRDARDSGRKVAPLVAAKDAVLMDSSKMTADAVVAAMVNEVRRRERAEASA